jgi:hypothetical protein
VEFQSLDLIARPVKHDSDVGVYLLMRRTGHSGYLNVDCQAGSAWINSAKMAGVVGYGREGIKKRSVPKSRFVCGDYRL